MKLKHAAVSTWKKVLEKNQRTIGKVRDKLREDLSEMEGLAESCDRAFDDVQRAIDALSELA